MQTLPQNNHATPEPSGDIPLALEEGAEDSPSAKTPLSEHRALGWPQAQGGKQGTRLRTRLLQTILPAVLIPLIAASLLGYRIISQRSEERIQEQLSNQALLASEGTTAVLDDLLDLPRSVANSPLVINQARVGSQEATAAGLTEMSIDEIEAEFSQTKLLRSHEALNTYLQQTVETAEIAEILVTDSHGFNVAYSQPVVDVVQSDEDWWQSGKANQQWIGPPDFDFASKGFTVELVQAILDPQNNNNFVGIIRAVVPTRKFSLLAGTLKRTGISGSQRVQLIDGQRLSTIDTFSAQGFHKDRSIIGGEPVEKFVSSFVAATADPTATDAGEILTTLRASQSNVKALDLSLLEDGLAVASFTSQGRQYKVANIASSNWVAIASMDTGEIATVGRDSLLFLTLLTLSLGALTTGIIFWLSRQLSKPIGQLTERVGVAASGNLDIAIEPTGTAETQFLTQTFNQLIARTKTLIQSQSIETEKVQLFADITSAPIGSFSEMGPLLERTLPTARKVMRADRLAFFQVNPSGNSLELNGARSRQGDTAAQQGWILAESTSTAPPATQYPETAPWLPSKALSGPSDQRPTIVIPTPDDKQTIDSQHTAFLAAANVQSSLNVPVICELSPPSTHKDTRTSGKTALWGYLIAHRTDTDQPWQPEDIEFLQQLSQQLQRVLDRVTAGTSIQRSHQEAMRSQQETAAITRTQQQQQENKRIEEAQLKQQISALSRDISGVFEGDLTVRAEIEQGELKTVADVFNITVAKLEELVGQVKRSTTHIDEVLGQNEATAQQLARLTHQQGQEAMRTLTTIQAASQSTTTAVEQAHHAAEFAQQVTDRTVVSRDAAYQAAQKIQTLNRISNNAVAQIQQLTRSSHNVSYMVTMISDIAAEMQAIAQGTAEEVAAWASSGEIAPKQSQILAKTTADMANLAERTASEARLIDTFLNSVDQTTERMIESIEQINQEVSDGSQTMQASQQNLNEVLTTAQQFEQLAQSVSQAIEEQSQVSQKVAELVTAVVDSSQQASGFSEEISQSLHDTAINAHQLRSSVSFFQVSQNR